LQNRLFGQSHRYRDFKILTYAQYAAVLKSLWPWSWPKILVLQSLLVVIDGKIPKFLFFSLSGLHKHTHIENRLPDVL